MPRRPKGAKRARDPAQLAKLVVDIATGAVEDREPTPEEQGNKSALARPDEILADRRVIKLNDAQWKAFIAALDAPPNPRPRLQRLLAERSIVD